MSNLEEFNHHLTSLTSSGGCAAKYSSTKLSTILSFLQTEDTPNVLIGFNKNDDAGVYKFSEDLALVFTVDINTPIIDNPYMFGQIAASNALSDIYAMGGIPIACLNIACFPNDLATNTIKDILQGSLNKIQESGAVLLGGHTIKDKEPKFGLSVIGTVHPNKIWANSNAKPGNVLILTKPIGNGVLFSAYKKKLVSEIDINECIRSSILLNKSAAEIASNFNLDTATDITGFGLLGHALEIAKASSVTIEIDTESVPIFSKSKAMYEQGISTSLTKSNLELTYLNSQIKKELTASQINLLNDPQTNGGLLLAISEGESEDLLNCLHKANLIKARIIGKINEYSGKYLTLN